MPPSSERYAEHVNALCLCDQPRLYHRGSPVASAHKRHSAVPSSERFFQTFRFGPETIAGLERDRVEPYPEKKVRPRRNPS